MASNDYYDSFHRPTPAQQETSYTAYSAGAYTAGGRPNIQSPPTPLSQRPFKPPVDTTGHSSPQVTSPFEDTSYPAYPPASSQYGARPESPHYYGRPGENASNYSLNDPFTDSNAIPLKDQGKDKLGPNVVASPTSAMAAAEQGPPRYPRYGNDSRTRRKRGWFKGPISWVCFILFTIQVIVFIYEIVRNATLTGSPIEIHPSFNPMIGPSPYVLINVGARYVPCMREINVTIGGTTTTAASPGVSMQCPNTTTNDAHCTLAELCGHGLNLNPTSDGKQPQPDQWWRFITPIFLHGGIIHIGFNMLLQLTLAREVEIQIGSIKFALIYFAAGIFGFIFGGNFAPNGIPSTGCSGSLFGIIALTLLDLLYTWKSRSNPIRDLMFILLDVVISFVLGLLPGLDNFSHIGGFVTGLVLGICLLHSPDVLRQRIGVDNTKYVPMPGTTGDGLYQRDGFTEEPMDQQKARVVDPAGFANFKTFTKNPVGFFQGRKGLWWAWWLLRAVALVGYIIAFALLLQNFYTYDKKCGWCKYLSCLPIKNWCDVGNLEFTDTASKSKRALGIVMDALKV